MSHREGVEGMSYWQKAAEKEMKNVAIAFKFQGDQLTKVSSL